MYIRKTTRNYKGKTYTNHLLVESVQTPNGPRQRTICSLGSLEAAPAEDWLALAHKLQSAMEGQVSLPDAPAEIEELRQKASKRTKRARAAVSDTAIVVEPGRVDMEEMREAGSVHVGHQMWHQLGIDTILGQVGFSQRACTLTEAMRLNRLICPLSEHAMPDWIRRTAMADILKQDFSNLDDEALYRNLDRLHPNREHIERELAQREKTLFNLEDTVYLYDLTSTYFEGQAKANPQAKRGYSRDKRGDCKQVVIGLVLDPAGFPKAHEVFAGNRQEKDRAIRETHEAKLLADLSNLQRRVAQGHLKNPNKIHQSIGRLMERYPRVARYYDITYEADHKNLSWKELADKKAIAQKLDGSYILKTDRQDLTADEIWRFYILLTRVEDAFRDIKSPLMERPIFHHLKNRTQTHIFLCVLAYHLLAAIEHRFLQAGIHTSWWTLRQQLSTHQVATIVLPTTDGRVLKIRKGSIPEPVHRQIYATLHIPSEIMKPIQTWHEANDSDEKNLNS